MADSLLDSTVMSVGSIIMSVGSFGHPELCHKPCLRQLQLLPLASRRKFEAKQESTPGLARSGRGESHGAGFASPQIKAAATKQRCSLGRATFGHLTDSEDMGCAWKDEATRCTPCDLEV
ncbi:unnamed protein product [Effrenium voratum]|nr:unnamed protein product [Effrenium voratum]